MLRVHPSRRSHPSENEARADKAQRLARVKDLGAFQLIDQGRAGNLACILFGLLIVFFL